MARIVEKCLGKLDFKNTLDWIAKTQNFTKPYFFFTNLWWNLVYNEQFIFISLIFAPSEWLYLEKNNMGYCMVISIHLFRQKIVKIFFFFHENFLAYERVYKYNFRSMLKGFFFFFTATTEDSFSLSFLNPAEQNVNVSLDHCL